MEATPTAPSRAPVSDTPSPKTVYEVRVSGLWSARHELREAGALVGVLQVRRPWTGVVTGATYRPEKGAVLTLSRDPGLRRGQFSMWSEGREWLGSSERVGPVTRVLKLHTGGKPFHLVPLDGFQKGWGLHAPRTGESARITAPLLSRQARIEVAKRVDFPLVLFAYFLATLAWWEAVPPGPEVHPGSL